MSDQGNFSSVDDHVGLTAACADAFRPTNDAIIAVGAMVSKLYLTLQNLPAVQHDSMENYRNALAETSAAMDAALKEIASQTSTVVDLPTDV